MATFGAAFTDGFSYSQEVTIPAKFTEVVVSQYGSWTYEIGFTVKYSNGTTIMTRSAGTTFPSNKIFGSWCAAESCPV